MINQRVMMVAFAPLVWAFMAGIFKVTPFVIKAIFKALGIGVLSYVGMTTVFGIAEAQVIGNLTGMPATIAAYASIAKLDNAVSMIMSAITFKIALNAFCGGVKKQLSFGFPRDC